MSTSSNPKRQKCDGKFMYPTQERAIRAALHANKLRGVPLRPYECPTCRQWHLTKRPANPVIATVPGPFTPADLARIVNRTQESA